MMIMPSNEIRECSKMFAPYEMYVEECDHVVLRPDAPDEVVEAFIKWAEYMTGEKPKITRWTEEY